MSIDSSAPDSSAPDSSAPDSAPPESSPPKRRKRKASAREQPQEALQMQPATRAETIRILLIIFLPLAALLIWGFTG